MGAVARLQVLVAVGLVACKRADLVLVGVPPHAALDNGLVDLESVKCLNRQCTVRCLYDMSSNYPSSTYLCSIMGAR